MREGGNNRCDLEIYNIGEYSVCMHETVTAPLLTCQFLTAAFGCRRSRRVSSGASNVGDALQLRRPSRTTSVRRNTLGAVSRCTTTTSAAAAVAAALRRRGNRSKGNMSVDI